MKLYALPLRNIVIQPGITVPLAIERANSIKTIEKVMESGQKIVLITQKSPDIQNPTKEDLYQFGTLALVSQMRKMPDNTIKIWVESYQSFEITDFIIDNESIMVEGDIIYQNNDVGEITDFLRNKIIDNLKFIASRRGLERIRALNIPTNLPVFIDLICSILNLPTEFSISLLKMGKMSEKLQALAEKVQIETELLNIDDDIKNRVKEQIEKNQKEFYLSEKIKAIQKEMGTEDEDDFADIKDKLKSSDMPKDILDKANTELKRLKNMPPMSAEGSVIRNYLEELIAVPWNKSSDANIDIEDAKKILNEDHDGLKKVKERILENIMVIKNTGLTTGSILCFVGPPGVGKTSLGASIARAMGRVYTRISLGGITDEAHFRGHRRTYIGSQPGRIIDALKKAKVNNPLIMLDEIDKIGKDYKGDPSAALLEILDPNQNKSFRDHYLEADFDLSKIVFIATANSLEGIHPALLDRMEIIELPGYIEDEKVKIAQNHLIPRAYKKTGLNPEKVLITEDSIRILIRYYTRESGVRNLEREIETLFRKTLMLDEEKTIINPEMVEILLGPYKYSFGITGTKPRVGEILGLAWTSVGGDVLKIETITMPGTGKINLTGSLGDVMKESAQIAKSYIQSRANDFGLDSSIFTKTDIHIHAPEGAVPKNGPSAGVALASVILSALTGIPIKNDVAMTGEITLTGRVLEIGGLREKLVGAKRAGVKKVLVPLENKKDFAEIEKEIYSGMEIIFVEEFDDVIKHVLTRLPISLEKMPVEASQSSTEKSHNLQIN